VAGTPASLGILKILSAKSMPNALLILALFPHRRLKFLAKDASGKAAAGLAAWSYRRRGKWLIPSITPKQLLRLQS
jgi:hypothetical protein